MRAPRSRKPRRPKRARDRLVVLALRRVTAVDELPTLVVAIGYVMINLVVDVSYAVLDPRIRVTGS